MMTRHDSLSDSLVDRVVDRLGLAGRPEPTLDGLRELYAAWCRRVPFDNVRKRIYLSGGGDGTLPGDDPDHFFRDWLEDGAGGTCWAGNGALCALLMNLGFAARRGIATMLAAPDIPPNHGTVIVEIDGRMWCVDASILHGEPLPLDEAETSVDHPAWGVKCRGNGDGTYTITWYPFHRPDGMGCRIDRTESTPEEFSEFHERSRHRSPFNGELAFRLLSGDRVIGIFAGNRGEVTPEGELLVEPLDDEGRIRFLTEEGGIALERAAALPPDEERVVSS